MQQEHKLTIDADSSTGIDPGSGQVPIKCPGCHCLNSPRKRFCSACGSSLTRTCPSCEAEISVFEKFCGTCGDSVASKSEQSLAEAEQLLLSAKRELDTYHFDSPAVTLARIYGNRYLSGTNVAAQAEDLLVKLKEQRSAAISNRKRLKAEAHGCIVSGQNDKAVDLLREIPEALHDEEIAGMLQRLNEQLDELKQLEDRVETAFSDKASPEDMHIADRLLRIVPEHKRAAELGSKIRDHVCKLAKAHFSKADFDKACSLLSAIPQRFQDETFRQVNIVVRDFDWMQKHLRFSTHVDETLAQCANRTSKRFPELLSVSPLMPQITKKFAEGRESTSLQLKRWAKHEVDSRFGARIDFLQFHEAVDGFDLFREFKVPYAATFSVATGLAIGGLTTAKYSMHLKGCEKKKFTLGKMGIGSAKHSEAIGLDIGQFCVRAVRVSEEKGRVRIKQVEQIDFEDFANFRDTQSRREAVVTALRKLSERLPIGTTKTVTVTALPDADCFFKLLRLPGIDKKKHPGALEFEVSHQIPFPLDAIAWTHHVLSDKAKFDALLFAAKQERVAALCSVFASAGMFVPLIQSSGVALLNLWKVVLDQIVLKERAAAQRTVGLLSMGDSSTTLAIAGPKRSLVRLPGFRSGKLTQSISRDLKLTWQQAVKVKHAPHLLSRMSELYRAIAEDLQALDRELELNFDALRREYPDLVPSEIYCTGGGSLLPGMLRLLRNGPDALVD